MADQKQGRPTLGPYKALEKQQPKCMFLRLLEVICSEGVWVRPGEGPGTRGKYTPAGVKRLRQPLIEIFHLDGQQNVVEPNVVDPRDSIILAHEYGHHLLVRNGEESARYRDLNMRDPSSWTDLPDEDRREILRIEKLAWERARDFLREQSFSQWAEFETEQASCLGTYREGLRLL